ncbi:thioredoxin reductase, putative [Theileria annulata]|uniref:thioredoxin-disulfide reductase (NADPH) n=1 Tax=Theileria annulata TaxID=5874 RepID=Q4UCW3_THEAN|nr:thioredoxin reductase, putative [Theileria annulata]CAI75338.1 thioredoxin reductase, putative [Theileria annulata]|eukprot:XP_954814.1 thioredoxin reductase, putative [Theileria annulata]
MLFKKRNLITITVPKIFLSSYLIFRQSDFLSYSFCYNFNHLTDYRNFFHKINSNNSYSNSSNSYSINTSLQSSQSNSYSTNTNSQSNHTNTNSNHTNTNTNFEKNSFRIKNMIHYDLIVLGGGPAGMAAAKEASRLGKRTVLFDYVTPSARGTSWGVGGTCVNVGCIPKKLMHYASLLRSSNYDKFQYGLTNTQELTPINWNKLIQTIQNYIKMLNFSYRSSLLTSGVDYINAFGILKHNKIIEYNLNNEIKYVSGDKIIIAIGERPYIPSDVEGANEYAITSDDLFQLNTNPGKTLIVGASYVALECAGFLTGLGYNVDVSVRSILLRGFDRQCVKKVEELMEASGVLFLYHKLPIKIEKHNQQLKVTFNDQSVNYYDTVLYAIGRIPSQYTQHLKEVGIEFDGNGNILVTNEETNIKDIYAVGDIVSKVPKLAPVAIKSSELLIQRLYSNNNTQMNYENVPKCVYTPFEYSSCGLTEEEAIEKYGEDNLEIYLKEYNNLEISPVHRINKKTNDEFDYPMTCLSKVICLKDGKIIGMHFVGPNAGEIMQGFSVLLTLNAKKSDLDKTVGIHPTDAESFVNLTVTKSSGKSWIATGGCAGGKCG